MRQCPRTKASGHTIHCLRQDSNSGPAFDSGVNGLLIGSVHPSESGTIAAFRVEKGESQLNEKGNVLNTFNQLLTCRIDIYSPFHLLSLS